MRSGGLGDVNKSQAAGRIRSGFMSVFVVFLVAELGDKTMLATITVGTQYHWLPVWIGSTVGMVAADAIAIAIGAVLGKKLPERAIQIGAAVLFFVAGAAMLAQGAWMLLG